MGVVFFSSQKTGGTEGVRVSYMWMQRPLIYEILILEDIQQAYI